MQNNNPNVHYHLTTFAKMGQPNLVFNLFLEYLVLPTYSIHSAHDSLIAVLLIHIDKITGNVDTISIGCPIFAKVVKW